MRSMCTPGGRTLELLIEATNCSTRRIVGEQSSPTILRVEQLVASINNSSVLPPGVHIERIYDRKDLIDITTATVLHNMLVGILLIVLLQWIFLGDLRSA